MAPSDPRPTKAERRETARAEAQRIRAAQEARAKRARLITIAGIVALVLVIGAVVWFVINNAKDGQSATTTSGGGADVELTGAAISGNLSAVEKFNAGAPGSISYGTDLTPATQTDGAPVVELYADFACPHCYDFEQLRVPALTEMAKNGEITFVMHPVAILDRSEDFSEFPSRAADAYYAIAAGDPAHLEETGKALFEMWHSYGVGGYKGDAPGSAQIAEAAQQAGVDQKIVDAIKGGSVERIAQASTKAMLDAGLTGTPTLMLNGEEVAAENWGTDDDGAELRSYILEQSK